MRADRLIELLYKNWQYHFEFLNLGYAAYVTFVNTANNIFPDIPISNLTKMEDGSYREVYNYAIAEATYPGSTFKLFTYLTALEQGIKPGDTISCAPIYQLESYQPIVGGNTAFTQTSQRFEQIKAEISLEIGRAHV